MLLLLGAASAQAPTTVGAEAATAPEPTLAADPAAAAPAAAAAPVAAAAGGLANRGTLGFNPGPAFYGPGLNNANAIRPNQQIIQLMQNYLKTAPNGANLRVFVGVDGQTHFTDQFGQETEVLHPTYGDLNELFQDPIELSERMTEFRQQGLDQAINRCQTELRQRFFTNPASFTPDLFAGLNIPTAGTPGAGARVVVA